MRKKLRRLIHLINGTYKGSFNNISKFRQLDFMGIRKDSFNYLNIKNRR